MILGMWLGAAICADALVTQNFDTIGRFMAAPGSVGVSAQIRKAGAKSIDFILRRNAAEENGWIFENWEWIQVFVATFLFFLILLGDRPPKSALVLVPLMLIVVLLQRLVITPHIVSLGAEIDEIPVREAVNNPTVSRFWAFHGFYAGSEIVKLLLGAGLGIRLMIRHRDPNRFAKDYELKMGKEGNEPALPTTERRVRKRRRSDQPGDQRNG